MKLSKEFIGLMVAAVFTTLVTSVFGVLTGNGLFRETANVASKSEYDELVKRAADLENRIQLVKESIETSIRKKVDEHERIIAEQRLSVVERLGNLDATLMKLNHESVLSFSDELRELQYELESKLNEVELKTSTIWVEGRNVHIRAGEYIYALQFDGNFAILQGNENGGTDTIWSSSKQLSGKKAKNGKG